MIQAISSLNWFSVLLAFVPYFFLGALWFTVLFKHPYALSLGRQHEEQQNLAPIFIIGPALCTLVITIASAILINGLLIESYVNALLFGLIVGIGYLVANTVNIAINPNIPRPLLYGAISGAYHLVGIVIVSLILVFMR
jgi:hypothetical protein